MRRLHVEPLSREAFVPFGEVIAATDAAAHFPINGGNTERYHDLAKLDAGPDGRLIVSIFRGQPRALPFTVGMLERHPLASQAFMPLAAEPYLVVVAPPGASPSASALRAFLAGPGQGVNYHPGVWHHPLLVLGRAADFLVIDRAGAGNNCDEISLTEDVLIELAAPA